MGCVVSTLGCIVGSVACTVGSAISNPVVDTTAAIALGQPELAADTFGSSTAADIAANAAASDAAAAAAGDTFGSSTAADIAANAAASSAASPGILSQIGSALSSIPTGASSLVNAGINALTGAGSNVAGSGLGASLGNLLNTSLSSGVLPGAALAALAYQCQADYNANVLGAYNSNLAAIQNYQNLYASGQGLPQLQLRNNAGNLALAAPGTTMANAPLRTQQNVVATPMAKDGGIMSVRKNYELGGEVKADWEDPTSDYTLNNLIDLIESAPAPTTATTTATTTIPLLSTYTSPEITQYNKNVPIEGIMGFAKGGSVKENLKSDIIDVVNKVKAEPDREDKKDMLKKQIKKIKKIHPDVYDNLKVMSRRLHINKAIKQASALGKQKTYLDTLRKVKLLRMTNPAQHKLLAQSVLSKPNVARIGQAMGSPMQGLSYSTSGDPITSAITPDNLPSGIAALKPEIVRNLQQALRGNPALLAKLNQLKTTQQGFGKKDGGRAHYAMGTPPMGAVNQNPQVMQRLQSMMQARQNPNQMRQGQMYPGGNVSGQIPMSPINNYNPNQMQLVAGGGIMGYATGGSIPEIDYRDGGGFVPPIGKKERADDIPAMLSNNEFVFTANAVRNAGGGDVKKGANKMYALMKHLEGK
jgi:hypothetical protein